MIAIFDTNSISVLRNYYPSAFPSLWEQINTCAQDGTMLSVREVYKELQNDNRVAFIQDWAKQHRGIFRVPDDDEQEFVGGILAVQHFQAVISQQALLKGSPVADPFVVASAAVKGGTVITEETLRPNAAKIPNICEHFEVECHNLEWFMQQQGWSF